MKINYIWILIGALCGTIGKEYGYESWQCILSFICAILVIVTTNLPK